MRMQLLKIVVVLLVAGSGDARPQRSDADSAEASDAGWRAVRSSNKSHDAARDDSRYTGTSGSNRKSYITHFRNSVDSLREHNAVGSRASSLAPNDTARSFGSRRSKIDESWTLPVFKATGDPPRFGSRTGVSGGISYTGVARNSSETGGPSLHGLPGNSERIHDGRVNWLGSVLASNRGLGIARTSYTEKANTENSDRSRSDAAANPGFKPMMIPRYSFPEDDHSISRASDFKRTNVAGVTSRDGFPVAGKNRQSLVSVRSNLLSGRNNDVADLSRWKTGQESSISSLQTTRSNVESDRQNGAVTRRNSSYRVASRVDPADVTSYESSESRAVVGPSRRVGVTRRDGLNNSGNPTRGMETRLSLIPNSKSNVTGHSRPVSPRTFNRNFVRLRRPSYSSNRSNQFVKYVEHSSSYRRNASFNVASNTEDRARLKGNNDVRSAVVRTRESTKRPDSNEHGTSKPTKNRYSSYAQKLPSQTESVDSGNETRGGHGGTSIRNTYLKNWPSEALHNIEDLYNYDKYTSSLVESSQDWVPQDNDGASFTSSYDGYINYSDPILDSSVKKIIHWLKIPAIVPGNASLASEKVHKPVESVLASIYGNLEPNRPLNVGAHDSDYETVVLQDPPHSQDYHGDYPNRWPDSSSIARPQYATDSTNSSGALTTTAWSDVALLKNRTVYNPMTHVTQNTVVHILNDGQKKPNVNVTQLKVPQSDAASAVRDEVAQKPDTHKPVRIKFATEKDEDEGPPKQETNTSSSDNSNCPTIMINSYTRVNNTIQSKEGCTDLNIIINSHVTNTNVFKPSSGPIAELQAPLATQSYGETDESNKYADKIQDLAHQDSLGGYVTASTGTYGSSPLETPYPAQSDYYYDPQRDPAEILGDQGSDPISTGLSTVEVYQGAQISVSHVPLADAEATAGPASAGADDPAGLSVDGPGVGDDASDSAADPPAGGNGDVAGGASASGPPVAGNPSSINGPATVNLPSVVQGLPSVVQGLPSSLQVPGTVTGQSSNALVPGSLQLPTLPNLPGRPGTPGLSGAPSSSHGSSSVSSSHNNNNNNDDDDDDDDDDYGLSPGNVLHSIASVFTYFSFMNPLGYSFFSLAAAPFAAMAAGVLGVAAFVFPWALPNVLDFGRAADKVTIAFRPSLEEFVRHAVRKYDRLNEWKSRRRKRRR